MDVGEVDGAVAHLACGQEVAVQGRKENWLNVRAEDGIEGWVGVTSVSKTQSAFAPILSDEPTASLELDECNAVRVQHSKNQIPLPLHTPSPEYAISSASPKADGVVRLLVTVGEDGKVKDIQVEEPLGGDMVQQAVAVVKNWTYAPALRDGTPVSARISVEVHLLVIPNVHLYDVPM
jgi:TonB family protein